MYLCIYFLVCDDGTVEVSNTKTMDITEVEIVQGVIDAVDILTELERELEEGGDIQGLLP